MSLNPSEKKALVLKAAEGLPQALVLNHIRRLDSDYFNEFSPEEIMEHLDKMVNLQDSNAFVFELETLEENTFGLTVIGEDVPGFFAALSGVIASFDFDIRRGKVFSYSAEIGAKGKIIDFLVLEYANREPLSQTVKEAFLKDLRYLVELLQNRKTLELQQDLYRRIGRFLTEHTTTLETPRLPLDIQVEVDDRQTVLTIKGTDRKAVLFTLSNALMMQGVSITKLLTKSHGIEFEDQIYIVDSSGKPISDLAILNRLKVAIILMERFTSTLPQASDYPTALQHFNDFIGTLVEKTGGNPELSALEDFSTLSNLAKILSAGPYLWEQMLRLPFGDLIKLLTSLEDEKRIRSRSEIEDQLHQDLSQASTYALKASALNRFKDYHLFRLDVVHLAYSHSTLQEFSGAVSDLAEVVLDSALWLAYSQLKSIHGEPQSDSNPGTKSRPCHFGLFAQGKLGGRELGFASDLELQLLFGNAGDTKGSDHPISHAEFFTLLMGEIRTLIVAQRDGIFELDLRLRPHGDSGPMASRLDIWVEYYSEGGGALDFERQALLKLRQISATPGFADKVMSARDAVLFGETPVGIENTLALRIQQLSQKVDLINGSPTQNAKYSPGGLVEVEYTVQFLQLRHGRKVTSLREPNTERALEILLSEGIVTPQVFEKLYKGYVLLRRVINALRMSRGHSRDLIVPPKGSSDFLHLAKRMGYHSSSKYEPEEQLAWDLRQTLKEIHSLFETLFLGKVDTDSASPSLTAAILDPNKSLNQKQNAWTRLGLGVGEDTDAILKKVFECVQEKGLLAAALVVSENKLRISPNPKDILIHLGQFLEAVPDADHFVKQILNHPYLQEILFKVFGHSDYLTQILIQNPSYILSLGSPENLEKPKLFSEFKREIAAIIFKPSDLEGALNALRQYRNKEYLRIGLRDIYLQQELQKITAEISGLSNALVESVFDLTMNNCDANPFREGIAVIALGKLGGNELNYSSDIDIVFVVDQDRIEPTGIRLLEDWAKKFIDSLSSTGTQGKLFRVDTQLRPYGGQSPLLATANYYNQYFQTDAAGWEMQSWLKARPLVGNLFLGRNVIEKIQAMALAPESLAKIESSMKQVRQLGLDKLRQENRLSTEVKLGPGGIRTIEFYVQYQQILHGRAHPELISGNTMAVLNRLFRYRLLSQNYYDILTKSYIFLRRIEHVLQLQGLQQRHELPSSSEDMEILAKRMGFEERIGQSASSQFRTRYRQHMLTLLELSSSLFGYDTNIPADIRENQ